MPIRLTPLEQLPLYWFTAFGPEAYDPIGSRSSEAYGPIGSRSSEVMAQLAVILQRLMAYYYRPTSSRSP